jgi:hypothetical protein
MAAGFTAADDKGICLTAGLEFGAVNVYEANDNNMNYYLKPMLIYENSFLGNTLDIYTELDYTIGFKIPADDGINSQSLYFDFMLGYNLSLGSVSTLSFSLENEFDELTIIPQLTLTGIFTPAVKYNHKFGFGDLFARVGAPITYYNDANATAGLDLTLGWNSTFGLGIETKLCTLLAPEDVIGFHGVETIISFVTGAVYIKIETIIPMATSVVGATITPEFNLSVWDLTLYLKCEFSGIGSGDTIMSPGVGVKFTL